MNKKQLITPSRWLRIRLFQISGIALLTLAALNSLLLSTIAPLVNLMLSAVGLGLFYFSYRLWKQRMPFKVLRSVAIKNPRRPMHKRFSFERLPARLIKS